MLSLDIDTSQLSRPREFSLCCGYEQDPEKDSFATDQDQSCERRGLAPSLAKSFMKTMRGSRPINLALVACRLSSRALCGQAISVTDNAVIR